MIKVDLTTLFGITPVNNTTTNPVRFRGGDNFGTFNFGLEGSSDSFVSNPLSVEFQDESKIRKIAKSNKRVKELLKQYNIKLKVNMEALENLKNGHLATTRLVAANICSALQKGLKREVNYQDIQQAAKLHDYGKVLIPSEILNKKDILTPEEKKIMDLHSEFGYELLRAQGVNENVCKLVKYHHQNPLGTGYPVINDDFEYGIDSQILAVADKYSALMEKRCYREENCTKEQALKIIYEDVKAGLISQEVFDALEKVSKTLVLPQKITKDSEQLQTTH